MLYESSTKICGSFSQVTPSRKIQRKMKIESTIMKRTSTAQEINNKATRKR